jgi:Glycosyl hydrolase family 9/Cellulase N-terminal ig-like domain
VTRVRRLGGVRGLSAIVAGGALAVAFVVATLPADAAVSGVVRVDQVGFLSGEAKQAYLMTTARVSGARFQVLDSSGESVLTGAVGATSRGSWNKAYPAVYPIDLAGLTRPGTYQIRVTGSASAKSPKFKVLEPAALYGKLVADGVTFFQTQRDGRNVLAGALGREPAHLGDAAADVYATPHFKNEDVIADRDLTRIGGPIDIEGGWFDAGDYLKFTHTTAYGAAVLLAAQRALGPSAPSTLSAEAHFGIDWLDKAWDQSTGRLYLQVGIGSGNAAGTFTGDHDLWRLPQDDDSDTTKANRYAAAHRPVFLAAAPGEKISPNLAGRTSAAFALAAQVDAGRDPARAAAEYTAAVSLYNQAATADPPSPLVTALPNEFYPEDTWRDDMEFGAAEIALAAQKLGKPSAAYLADAATFAKGYITSDNGDTFNLYDTSALAHADLLQALKKAGNPGGLAVTPAALVTDLKRQVQSAASKAQSDIFHAGGDYTNFDVDSHMFGLLATEALYRKASGDTAFAAFATQQRNWLLGANAWGTSFMIGAGTTFPICPQHQVSNLRASSDGSPPVLTGAVVNGPNDPKQFSGGLGDLQDGMVKCPTSGDEFKAFNGHGSRYVDDVRAWQTDEPAIDMTGSAIIGAALQQAIGTGGGAPGGGGPGGPGTGGPGNGGGTDNDYTIAVSAPTVSVPLGESAALTVTANGAQAGPLVALAVTGMPADVTVALAPAAVVFGRPARMTVSAFPTAKPGTYTLTVTGTGVNLKTHTATVKLTIT